MEGGGSNHSRGRVTRRLLPPYLFLVSVDVDQVEGEEVVLGAHQQPSSLLVQQEGVVAGAVRQAVKGDQVTGLQHLCRGKENVP